MPFHENQPVLKRLVIRHIASLANWPILTGGQEVAVKNLANSKRYLVVTALEVSAKCPQGVRDVAESGDI